jgi:hypothetical protein
LRRRTIRRRRIFCRRCRSSACCRSPQLLHDHLDYFEWADMGVRGRRCSHFSLCFLNARTRGSGPEPGVCCCRCAPAFLIGATRPRLWRVSSPGPGVELAALLNVVTSIAACLLAVRCHAARVAPVRDRVGSRLIVWGSALALPFVALLRTLFDRAVPAASSRPCCWLHSPPSPPPSSGTG